MPKTADYAFTGGYPAPKTVQRAYDEADLNRAILAYGFSIPPSRSWQPGRAT